MKFGSVSNTEVASVKVKKTPTKVILKTKSTIVRILLICDQIETSLIYLANG